MTACRRSTGLPGGPGFGEPTAYLFFGDRCGGELEILLFL
jgi:hypothetical protein